MKSLSWFIALRYLQGARRPKSRSLSRILKILAALVVLSYANWFAAWGGAAFGLPAQFLHLYETWSWVVFLSVTAVAIVGSFFVFLAMRLTIFATISTYGLFLGSAALVIVLSVMSGFEKDLQRKILGTNAHIVVAKSDSFSADELSLDKLRQIPEVTGVSPFISSEVMLSSPSNLSGVVLKGIDPETAPLVSDLARNLESGKLADLLNPPPPKVPVDPEVKPGLSPRKNIPALIIGRELARSLSAFPGDEVQLISPLGGMGPTGPIPKSRPFRVVGVFYTGMFEYDSKYVYATIPVAQKFLDLRGEITGVELKVKQLERSEMVVAQARTVVGPNFDVKDWKELNRSLFSALKLEKIAMFIALCFIVLVAAFSIVANGVMLVMEKGAEIAILKAMGATDRLVLSVFILLGLYLALVGILSGITMGILSCFALGRWGLNLNSDVYYITKLPIQMSGQDIFFVCLAALLIAIAATLYPAWLAARLRPIRALRVLDL